MVRLGSPLSLSREPRGEEEGKGGESDNAVVLTPFKEFPTEVSQQHLPSDSLVYKQTHVTS